MAKSIDDFVESEFGLVALDLPEKDKAPESGDPLADLARTLGIRLSFDTKKYGRGHMAIALDPKNKKLAYVAVSPNLIHPGRKKSALVEAKTGRGIYDRCWDKPTIPGVVGCIVSDALDWWVS